MNYQQTIDYLFSQLPMFQRIGAAAYKANLDNTHALDALMNHPHREFMCVHIAGTNGKGSVAHLLASILQESGLKTGLFTSPHLKDFRERIKVNGNWIGEEAVIEFVEKYKSDFERIKPSFFEMTFSLAMRCFADCSADIAVVETGMGGRLDSTNIISPLVSVITNIGYDHMQFLGNTLEAIAREKAGIIKPRIPVVLGRSMEEYHTVFQHTAIEKSAAFHLASERIGIDVQTHDQSGFRFNYSLDGKICGEGLHCPLGGNYQIENLKTVLMTAELLKEQIRLTPLSIASGISRVIENTGLRGRWEILSHSPLIVCDTAHNADGLSITLKQLQNLAPEQIHFVLGFVNDKDISGILNLFPKDARYYFSRPDIPRGLDVSHLVSLAGETGLTGTAYTNVAEALSAAKASAAKDDVIYIGGSTFVVAEVI